MLNRSNLIGFYTLLQKEVSRIIRIWPQTILPAAITMTLYFIIFGNLIGSRIGTMDNVNYIAFMAPGLIIMSVINNAYTNVSASFFSNKFQRSIEQVLISPMSSTYILLGFISGGVARGLIVGFIVSLVALFFTHLTLAHIAVMIIMVVLAAVLFSLAGLLNGIFAKKFDDISIVPTFVLTPLTYLGGVFYSIDLLPKFWYYVSLCNPILYIVNAFRYGMIGVSDIPVAAAILATLAVTIALFFVNLYLIKKGKGLRS